MRSTMHTAPTAPHTMTPPDRYERSDGQDNFVDSQSASPPLVGHGFLTASQILALLLQLDVDGVIARLDGAPGPTPGPLSPAGVPTQTRARYERRVARRMEPRELPADLRLTSPGASGLVVVNISDTGVLLETSGHARLGATADLSIRVNGRRYSVRARTVRSTVVAVKPESGAVYHTALEFERPLRVLEPLRS